MSQALCLTDRQTDSVNRDRSRDPHDVLSRRSAQRPRAHEGARQPGSPAGRAVPLLTSVWYWRTLGVEVVDVSADEVVGGGWGEVYTPREL